MRQKRRLRVSFLMGNSTSSYFTPRTTWCIVCIRESTYYLASTYSNYYFVLVWDSVC